MDILKKLLSKSGIDSAVLYVLAGKGISFIVQPVTLYLIATCLTSAEQGYYYTFGSILSASIFLELGLGTVLTQFASHEFASLSWGAHGSLTGDAIALSRLISLTRKSVVWYGIMSILVLASFIPGGTIFLNSSSSSAEVDFVLPWVFLVVFSSLTLFLSPLLAIIEGCARVADIQRMRMYQIGFGALFVWIVIVSNGSLYAASSLAITNFVIGTFWLMTRYNGLLNQVRGDGSVVTNHELSWKRELFPLQWKIGVSWVSGYLTFHLFTPLLFQYQNAVAAGQMGMSLYVSNIALSTGIAWLSTKFPLYGAMIKRREYDSLDHIVLSSTVYSFVFTAGFSLLGLLCIVFIKADFPGIGDRLLSIGAVAALLFSGLINVLITSMAVYLRAHKQEPLLASSIVCAIVTVVVGWVAAKYYSADVMAYSIAVVSLVVNLPLTTYIFLVKRKGWRNRVDELPVKDPQISHGAL